MSLNPESTKEQKDALSAALFQHANRMGTMGANPEDIPEGFTVPTYSENLRPLYDNQLFPAVSNTEDLMRVGYATPDGQITQEGQMAIALKKAGGLNEDYTLNQSGRAMLASRDDLLKEENIDLYIESKKLKLDEQEDIGLWDGIKQLASDVGKGAKTIGELALLDASSGGTFTPEQQAERRIKADEIVKDMAISTATVGKGLVTAEDKLWAKVFNEGVMQDYQVAYLDQKFDRDMADMEKVNTSEVADELAKVIGVETQFAEGRKQAEVTLGDEETQRAIEEGRKAGLALSIVNPLAPESVVAGVGFGVARKGLAQAFKPISRKLLESEAKAARALEASQRVTGLNSHLAQTKYLAQKAEQEALFAERQADKYSKLGLPDRANAARTFANNLRTKGLEAAAKAQGLTDEIARASDDAAKLAQDAAVADKINFVAQKARALPGLPIQAVGGLVEGVGRAMIGIDKGLATLASKVGADKAWNAMNKISSLSGLGGAGAAMGLGPVAFVPAAVRTAWSTAPFLKGAGHFIRMIGKETANARGQIPFWQRVANYETLGAVPRAVAHLMDTSTLGSRVTGFAGDVTKGMAASYPVDLAFQWISEGGEMDMNTLKQAAAETVVFGGTGAALGGITAGSQERIKKLQRGDAMNFYRNLKDGSQRVAFNALNDGIKRSIGTYSASFPNLNIRFTDQGGGAFDPASNTAFINPMSRNPLKPLLAHEINHYILVRNQMEGGIAAALVGDGVQTGGLLRGKDGKLDENFQAFKEEYTRRLETQHNRRIDEKIAAGDKVTAKERSFIAPTDNDIAIEYFVDSMADDMMGMAETGELGKKAGRMLVTRKMQAFGNAIMQQAPIIKDFFYKLGGATDKAGRAVYGNGLLAEGIREIPEMKKLFRKMISESAGRPMHVAKVTKGESEGHNIPIVGKDDPILDEMTSMFESDENGVPLRDKNGDRILLSDATEQLRSTSGLMLMEDQQNRINRGETLEPGELRFSPEENAWTGEYLTDRQIQLLRASGRFNKAQIRQLEMLNGAARENTGRRFLVFNQPATKKRKRKGGLDYATLGVSMREIVPYGIKITKDGNILVRLMSVQQLHANAFEKATSKRGQSLYKGDAEAILNDVNQVIENHGRNEPTDAYFKSKYGTEWEVRKNFINTVFGNVGKGQKDINPLLAAEKAKNAVVKTYRIDRINKATELEGRTMLPYQNHLVKVNFMPEGEPILDANGEPKDLRYTPSYEQRMPEAQRATPDGEQKPTRFMPEDISPEDLNPVANAQEAQGRWADGKRMFAINEMDEKLIPITSKEMLESYPADAIGWMEPESAPAGEQAGKMRFMPEATPKDSNAGIKEPVGSLGDLRKNVEIPKTQLPLDVLSVPKYVARETKDGDWKVMEGANRIARGNFQTPLPNAQVKKTKEFSTPKQDIISTASEARQVIISNKTSVDAKQQAVAKVNSAIDKINNAVMDADNNPEKFVDVKGYAEIMKNAGVTGDILVPPSSLRTMLYKPDDFVALLDGGYHGDKTVAGIRDAAMSGLDAVVEMRKLIGSQPPDLVTALHHLWGTLSKQLPPLQQEALWMRMIVNNDVMEQIGRSIDGTFNLSPDQWKQIVLKARANTKGTYGKLGENATSNANSFYLMLAKHNGKWNEVSNVYATNDAVDMRYKFNTLGHGATGIKNKVQSFIGLTFGIKGNVLDRWRFVDMFLDDAMKITGAKTPREYFKYEGKSKNVPVDKIGIYKNYGTIENGSPLFSLALYSAMDRVSQRAIDASPALQKILGNHADPGGLHWLSWNAIKNEAVGHSSLDITKNFIKKYKKGDNFDNLTVDNFVDFVNNTEAFVEGTSGAGDEITRLTLKNGVFNYSKQ